MERVGALFRNRDVSNLNLVQEVGHADCSFIMVLLNLLQPNAMVVGEVRPPSICFTSFILLFPETHGKCIDVFGIQSCESSMIL